MSDFKFNLYEYKEDYLIMTDNFKEICSKRNSLTYYHYILYNLVRDKDPQIDVSKMHHHTYHKLKNNIFTHMCNCINGHYTKLFNISNNDFVALNGYIYDNYLKGTKHHEDV